MDSSRARYGWIELSWRWTACVPLLVLVLFPQQARGGESGALRADTLLSSPRHPPRVVEETVRRPFELGIRLGPAFGDGEVSRAGDVSIDRELGYALGMSVGYFPLAHLGIRATYLHYFYDVAYASVLEEEGGDLRVISLQVELVLTFREGSESPFYISAGVARADFGAEIDSVDTDLETVSGFVVGIGTNHFVARSSHSAMSIHVGLSVLISESTDRANEVTWQGQLPVLLLGASYHF